MGPGPAPGPGAGQELEERVEPVRVEGFSLPGRLPASPGVGFEARSDPGPGHLVAEERACDAALGTLVPTNVPALLDTGPPGVLALPTPGRGPQAGGGVAQLLVRCTVAGQLEQRAGRTVGDGRRLAHQLELGRREVGLLERTAEGRIGGGPSGRGQTGLGHRSRGARDRPEPIGRRPVAGLGVRTRLEDHRGEQRDARCGRPLGLREERHHAPGLVTRGRRGRGAMHQALQGAHGLLQLVFEVPGRER